ncbi:spermidine synthase [Neobacillus niacini]|uniref:spermine/spermidine synthase domain-containing protein n=1 Tax=Neobacillus niacini TaxID=86668 RepID=UPI00052F9BF6|nr:spermidine synthase [Neobacillus niacini]KGM45544.1 spermidine synthase [Neobacillus niacini]MEC1521798.1 spermidine synthase [Neobacillus niacini]
MSASDKHDSFRGDVYDLIELEQLVKGPHQVLFEGKSPYQDVLLLETKNIRLYRNDQLVWNSLDERIYHEALVHPAFVLSDQPERVLIIGDECGFALREVLKYSTVCHVSHVSLSPATLVAAKNTPEILEMNERSFFDHRVQIIQSNIYEFLLTEQQPFDVIIANLPEPETNQLSKLYSKEFFKKLSTLLTHCGIMVIQSASPEDTPLVFWSIDKTLQSASLHTLNYHVNSPWFGDCGFHLAGKKVLKWNDEKNPCVENRSLPKNLKKWFTFSQRVRSVQKQAVVLSIRSLNLNSYSEQDPEDTKELRHLLSNPHRVLYEGGTKGDCVKILETNDVRLYLDKQLQFSSLDEQIYHEALVHPALSMVRKRERILIAGGGDGFAIREVLKYRDVKHIDLVDLDPLMIHLAGDLPTVASLNQRALHDKRVSVHQKDIQVFQKEQSVPYDVIIVDLPDPGDEILSRLYTVEFFCKLSNLLTEDGILVCQSHSPEYAPFVYWSIGLSLKGTGMHVKSYHTEVPSFGDWGFHLASKKPIHLPNRKVVVPHQTLPEDLSTLFVFPSHFRSVQENSRMNTLSNLTLHEIYKQELRR